MENKIGRQVKKNILLNNIILIISGAVIFFLAHPNYIFKNGIGFLGYLIYLPFCLLLKNTNIKNSFFYGGIYGSLSYILFLFWLRNFHPVALLFIPIYFFVLYGILFLALKLLEKIYTNYCFILQILCVCIFEYLRTLGFLGFPYGQPGYTQWQFIPLIQLSNITGISGLNLLVIIPGFLIAKIIELKKSKNKTRSIMRPVLLTGSVWICLFIFSLIYGTACINKYVKIESQSGKITAALIQNNEHPWENGIESHNKNVSNLIELSKNALKEKNVELIVWPETSVAPSILYHFYKMDNSPRFVLAYKIINFMLSSEADFVIGNVNKTVDKNGKEENTNSVLHFSPGKNVFPPEPVIYSKQHLVPLSESFPWENIFPKIAEILKNGSPDFWEAGKENVVFNFKDLSFVTPVCFEDTFGNDCRKMILDLKNQKDEENNHFEKNHGAAFINLSNDSWSESLVCQKQHLSMAVFRSAENNIPSVRSTTSGQTAYINGTGKVVKELVPFCSNYLICEIPVIGTKSMTFYTAHGDLFSVLIIICFSALLIIRLITVIIKKLKINKQ